jgi:hypothetical protein
MLTDPVADMLARIRNANKALHESAEMPTSRLKEGIARILKEEGYISDFHVKKGESFDTLVIQLKYGRSRERIITDLKRVSKPGAVSTPARIVCRACSADGCGDSVDVDRPGHCTHRGGEGNRRRSRVLRLVRESNESNRQTAHRIAHRRERVALAWARDGQRPLGELSQQVPARMKIEQETARSP